MPVSKDPDNPFSDELALRYNYPFIGNLKAMAIAAEVLATVSANTARRLQILPLKKTSRNLMVAIGRAPSAGDTLELQSETGMVVEYVIADRADLQEALLKAHGS